MLKLCTLCLVCYITWRFICLIIIMCKNKYWLLLFYIIYIIFINAQKMLPSGIKTSGTSLPRCHVSAHLQLKKQLQNAIYFLNIYIYILCLSWRADGRVQFLKNFMDHSPIIKTLRLWADVYLCTHNAHTACDMTSKFQAANATEINAFCKDDAISNN